MPQFQGAAHLSKRDVDYYMHAIRPCFFDTRHNVWNIGGFGETFFPQVNYFGGFLLPQINYVDIKIIIRDYNFRKHFHLCSLRYYRLRPTFLFLSWPCFDRLRPDFAFPLMRGADKGFYAYFIWNILLFGPAL